MTRRRPSTVTRVRDARETRRARDAATRRRRRNASASRLDDVSPTAAMETDARATEVVDLTGASSSSSDSSRDGKAATTTRPRMSDGSDSDVVVVESASTAREEDAEVEGGTTETTMISEEATKPKLTRAPTVKTETGTVVRETTPEKPMSPVFGEETPVVTPETERAAEETPAWARTPARPTAAAVDEEATPSSEWERTFCRGLRRALELKAEQVRALAECVRRTPRGEMTDEGVRRAAAATLKEAKALWRREERAWADAVVRAQQKTPSSSRRASNASESGRSASAREAPSMTLPFWLGVQSHKSSSSSTTTTVATAVASSASGENKRAYKNTDGWQFDQKTRRSTVPRITLAAAKGVPPYKYFAYTTQCSSYEHADNGARLLFADDDGELLESDPVDERAEKDEDFTRLEEFQLCSVAARFSHIALPEDGPKPMHSLIDETAKSLKVEKERVVEWFSDIRTRDCSSRIWRMFLETVIYVHHLCGRFEGEGWRIQMANVFEVLRGVDAADTFWRGFARIVINSPTIAKLKKPVFRFDTLEEATEQLASTFCPRCFIFDCRTHGSMQIKSMGRKMAAELRLRNHERFNRTASRDARGTNLETQRCSAQCWYQSDAFKYYSSRAVMCGPCEGEPQTSPDEDVDPFSNKRKKWRNSMDIEILKKAVDIIGGDPLACDAALFFGTRRTCAEVGMQMHCLQLMSNGTNVMDEEEEDEENKLYAQNSKKRKRAGKQTARQNPTIARRLKMLKDGDSMCEQYQPCECVGACDPKTCSCIANGTFCERFCNCGPKCPNEAVGCKCESKKMTCRSVSCPCFSAGRECTPDKCKRCCKTADAVLLPIRKKWGLVPQDAKAPMPPFPCGNMKLQLGQKEHLGLGKSNVAGWGTFSLNGARKGDFIGEYVGELITQDEADRRGTVYDQNGCSYLFNLNSDWAIDAQNVGNKLRFANHSHTPNITPKVLTVNGDNRLAFFACKDIKPGEELFFFYNYKDEVAPDWHDDMKGKHDPPKVKSAKKTSKL